MGRPTKFTPVKGKLIAERLRVGATRKAAAESVGVWYSTFLDWLARGEKARSGQFLEFFEAVQQAEAACELEMARTLEWAAQPHEAGEVERTTRTVFKLRKTRTREGAAVTVTEEYVPFEEVTEVRSTRIERDWRAAESWLKRRGGREWSEKTQEEIVIRDFEGWTDEEIEEYARTGRRSGRSAAAGESPGGA